MNWTSKFKRASGTAPNASHSDDTASGAASGADSGARRLERKVAKNLANKAAEKARRKKTEAFDKMVAETVEQVKAGNLSMDHQRELAEPGEPGPAGSPDRQAKSLPETAKQDARSMQSGLSETLSGGVGAPEDGVQAVAGEADAEVEVEVGAKDEAAAAPRIPDISQDEATSHEGGSSQTSETHNATSLTTDVKKQSRAERDMAAMKQAPNLSAMVRKDVIAGGVAVAVFLVFLIGWSSTAPLSSAAIAPGVISPHGSRKTVQHLEGGIIDKILVENGSTVEAGDPLVLLEDTMARASWGLIRTQYYTLAARQARLSALQSGAQNVLFPDWLMQEAGEPGVASILATELNLLKTRRQAHSDRKAVLQQRIGQLEKEIEGLNAQISGQTRQLVLIAKEISGVQQLVDKGLERMPRLLGLQRTEAQIRAQRGSNTAMIARTEQAISAAELELISADTVLQDEIARELAQVQTDLSQAGERMAASDNILKRIEIRAPVAGKILGLRYHTAGGVIAPGAAILDIVPAHEDLIIEARVSPMDIDVVYEGLTAQIHLSAFSQRNLPMIEGIVSQVSADRLVDEVTGEPYFSATVEVSKQELAKIGEGVTLTAGMPAEVMIVTGEQTLLGYLVTPALDTLRRSFREG